MNKEWVAMTHYSIMTGLPGVGANPMPNCKLGFGSWVRSDCVQTLSSLINYVGENDWVN